MAKHFNKSNFTSTDVRAITPSDSSGNDFESLPRQIRAGSSGTMVVVLESGDEITYTNCFAGERFDTGIVRVKATGTTVTGIVGHW